jgi:hypothetical protein
VISKSEAKRVAHGWVAAEIRVQVEAGVVDDQYCDEYSEDDIAVIQAELLKLAERHAVGARPQVGEFVPPSCSRGDHS